jgi:hypothetical protein
LSTYTLYSLPIGETLCLSKRDFVIEIARPNEFLYNFNITNLADGKQQQFEFSRNLLEIFSRKQNTTTNNGVN